LRKRSTLSASGGREVLDVALSVHLGFFPVRRRRQGHDPEDARADPLGYGLDRAALPGRISALKQNDDAQPFRLHPILHVTKLDLQLAQLLFVELALDLAVVRGRLWLSLRLGHGG
jgi:hypothetical protein